MDIEVRTTPISIRSYDEAEDLFNYASFRLRNNPPTKKKANERLWLNIRNCAIEAMDFFKNKG